MQNVEIFSGIMLKSQLPRTFYNRKTLAVAKGLLGKKITRRWGKYQTSAYITETEAYFGFKDKASHAHKGKTKRTEVMFGAPGFSYIYMIYGMYFCLNIVTEREGYPAAVLVRGIIPLDSDLSIEGPGKTSKYLKINKNWNNLDLLGNRIWIEEGREVSRREIIKEKRVGIDYAEEYKDKLWRFVWKVKQ